MTYRQHALQLAIIDLVFILLLSITYAYIELASIAVDDSTYVIMQLTAIISLGMIVLLGGFIYYTEYR